MTPNTPSLGLGGNHLLSPRPARKHEEDVNINDDEEDINKTDDEEDFNKTVDKEDINKTDYEEDINKTDDKEEINKTDGSGMTALNRAAYANNTAECRTLLLSGADPNIANNGDMSPLHWAGHNANLELCHLLYNSGATLETSNDNGYTPLQLAALSGSLPVVMFMIERGAVIDKIDNCGSTPLLEAARRGHLGVCEYLVEKGAHVSHADLIVGGENGHLSVCKFLREKVSDILPARESLLYCGARWGEVELCQEMINMGADMNKINRDGNTPVLIAAKFENDEVCQLLAKSGADLNIADKTNLTPLYYICEEGNHHLAQFFIQHGADPNSVGCLQISLEMYHKKIFNLLIKSKANVNNPNKSSKTPLMNAAKTSSLEAVEQLLTNSADPNLVDEDGLPALGYGLKSGNKEIIKKLAAVTTTGLETCITLLAQSTIAIEGEVQTLVENMVEKGYKDLVLKKASFYGCKNLLEYLLKTSNQSFEKAAMLQAVKDSIVSDDADSCEVVQEYFTKHFGQLDEEEKQELDDLVILRGKRNIMKIYQLEKAEEQEKLLRDIPKDAEFEYFDIMSKIIPMVEKAQLTSKGRLVPFETLREELHVPPVHYQKDNCPEDCPQENICIRIRQVVALLDQVLEILSKDQPIFKNAVTKIVGSLKESTKIGKIDEADLLLVCDGKLKQYFSFDKKQQRLKINARMGNVPDWIKIFLSDDELVEPENDAMYNKTLGYLNEKLYFKTFMKGFYEVIKSGTLDLPEGLTLSTEYTPCDVCTNKENTREQIVRCRHQADCEDHKKKMRDTNHEETCNCREYTSPCLTFSKIGLVLHLQFTQKDRGILNLDIDINPPTIPIMERWRDEFDGRNVMKRERLEREREQLVDWKGEWIKSEDNSEAAGEDDGLKRSVRLRFFNQRDVIAEQVGNII